MDPSTVYPELQTLADHWATTHHLPALVWGVMLDGQLTLSGHSGQLDDGSSPTTRTVFRIASMTKPFTAATVLRLRDDGLLTLDDPVPDLPSGPTSDSTPITLRHLLSMQSGFTADDPWADRHLDLDAAELDAILAAGPRFGVPPGTAFEYSNLGFAVIGRAVQRWIDRRIQDLVDEVLLQPLGLQRTTWHCPSHDDWARPYRVEDDAPVRDGEPVGDGVLAPMGGLWSTVDDLVRVMAFFDDAFPPRDGDDNGPLRRSSRREQQQVQRAAGVTRTEATGEGLDHVPERIDASGYGFGMQIVHDQRFGNIVGHSGGLPGYGSNMRWLPGRRVGAVALANATYAPMRLLTRRMLEVLDDHDFVPPVAVAPNETVRAAGTALLALVNDWSDRAADELFADNVGLDESFERRARVARDLIGAHGQLTLERIDAALDTDATAIARAGDSREVRLWFALSPLREARIQEYTITAE
jgi:CubicO group peptidase (beta-lactamase class C family)